VTVSKEIVRARLYLLGLLSSAERKNSWTIAEQAGEASPDGMQRLLNFYRWDAEKVRDGLRGYVLAELGDPAGVVVADLCRHRDYAEAGTVRAWWCGRSAVGASA